MTLTDAVVGLGGSGIVRKGTLRRADGRVVNVAIKQLQAGATENEERRFVKEFTISCRASARCPRACVMYGCVRNDGALCLVMKLYPQSLHEFLDARRSPDGSNYARPLSYGQAVALTEQILEGLVQLHAANIVIRDLKPKNVLMDERGQLVISDFGLAAMLTSTLVSASSAGGGGGTPGYMAPEQYDPDTFGSVSPKTDMWALGCIVVELLSGFPPWRGIQPMQIMMAVAVKKQKPPVPVGTGEELAWLLHNCFKHNQSARPTAQLALGRVATSEPEPEPEPIASGGRGLGSVPRMEPTRPSESAVKLAAAQAELAQLRETVEEEKAARVAAEAAQKASIEQAVVAQAAAADPPLHIGARVPFDAGATVQEVEVVQYMGESVFCRFPDGQLYSIGDTVAAAATAVKRAAAKQRAEAERREQDARERAVQAEAAAAGLHVGARVPFDDGGRVFTVEVVSYEGGSVVCRFPDDGQLYSIGDTVDAAAGAVRRAAAKQRQAARPRSGGGGGGGGGGVGGSRHSVSALKTRKNEIGQRVLRAFSAKMDI